MKINPNPIRGWSSVAVLAICAALIVFCLPSRDRADEAPYAGEAEKAAPELIVHEWGTFTSFVGSDGVQRSFREFPDDLPDFVHKGPRNNGNFGSKSGGGIINGNLSMETPVLYFYSKDSLNVSVSVKPPILRITENFPSISAWDKITLLPGVDVELPTDSARRDNHYFAARETDAVPLKVDVGSLSTTRDAEYEKFLFYRGVASSLNQPIQFKALGNGRFTLKNNSTDKVAGAFLVVSRGGKIAFSELGSIAGGAEAAAQEPARFESYDQLGAVLVKALVADGLYEKEARAMVQTWDKAWFGEEGTRVLYLFPRPVTDAWLPIDIKPMPQNIRRSMVGRIDILTPEQEREIDRQYSIYLDTALTPDEISAAWNSLPKLGRFFQSALAASRERLDAKKK
jgi:hypothetical protein